MTADTALRPIIIITKTDTQNQGNQALSVAWRDVLRTAYPDRRVVPVERVPAYLKRYRIDRLAKEADPVAALDRIAGKLARRARDAGAAAWPASDEIRHTPTIAQPVRNLKLRRALRIRSRLVALGLGGKDYDARLAMVRDAALVVVNPAGEFYPAAEDSALAYLLELRTAQLLGIPTAMVNLSFEVTHPVVKALSAHVIDKCELIEFRDDESRDAYREAGGQREPLILPDGALLTVPPAATGGPVSGRGEIALAINALQVRAAGLEDEWTIFIDRVIEAGLNPVLTSNEWTTDEPFWGALIAGGKARSEGRDADYRQYMELLGGFDVVVSSRLHTCVLGIVAGTAVVPVETGTFKLTGFFKQIGLGALPIKLGSDNWQDRVIERIADIRRDRAAAVAHQSAQRDIAVARLRDGLQAAFASVPIL